MSDIENINKAVAIYQTSGQTNLGSANTVYVSIPKNVAADCSDLGLPSLPGGYSYGCVSSSTLQKTDGTGWIPLAFSSVSYGTPLEKLPIDPLNSTSSLNYYTYTPGTNWELTAVFESQKYIPKEASDGGSKSTFYEAGTNLALTPAFIPSGSVAYANMRLSMINGTAFADFGATGILTSHIGAKLTITDSAGKKLVGYIKTAGAGETYGSQLLSNSNAGGGTDWTGGPPPTGWNTDGCTLAAVAGGHLGNNALQITRSSGSYQAAYQVYGVSLGALYMANMWVKSGTSGDDSYYIATWDGSAGTNMRWGTTSASWTQSPNGYWIASNTIVFLYLEKVSATAGTMLFDNVTFAQVLTPSATGVTIVSTSGGSTYNWASEDSGFNRYDANGYTYKIES